ncbi:MAG: AAA family ATPase [Thermomicrobiaceae bacterium]
MVDTDQETREHVSRIYADLSRPEAFPEDATEVSIEETHISIVFLVGDTVYKIKRPVDFGFLDFSTLEKRKFYGEEEVRLNSRLTYDVYHGVVPVTDDNGRYKIEGDGPVKEWAVKMRRLPDEGVLAELVKQGTADEHVLNRVVERLVAFYPKADTGENVDEWGSAEAVGFNIQENVDQSQPYVNKFIAPTQLDLIDKASKAFLTGQADLMQKRVDTGKIRDGHGDLHLKHIIIEGPRPEQLQIIDGVEFNPRIRCGDIAMDVAFLAMDLDFHRRPDLANHFIDQLTERMDDKDMPRLVQFYKAYRAHVRAKVACFMSENIAPELEEFVAIRGEIENYIDLATSYLVKAKRPAVVIIGGLSGTGKSVLARRIARTLEAVWLSSDRIRKEITGYSPHDRLTDEYGSGIYSPEISQETYDTLISRGVSAASSGKSVVIDATFLDEDWRSRARDAFNIVDADLQFVECWAPAEVVAQRLEERQSDEDEASDAGSSIYEVQRERYGEQMAKVKDLKHIVVDTNRTSAEAFDDVLKVLDLVPRQ